jgi:hypothetical protein
MTDEFVRVAIRKKCMVLLQQFNTCDKILTTLNGDQKLHNFKKIKWALNLTNKKERTVSENKPVLHYGVFIST